MVLSCLFLLLFSFSRTTHTSIYDPNNSSRYCFCRGIPFSIPPPNPFPTSNILTCYRKTKRVCGKVSMGRTNSIRRRKSGRSSQTSLSLKPRSGMEIRHVKGQLSKAKKAIATAVHKSNIPSGTAKFLQNVQMFCGPSPRNSLLSLQSETIHASEAFHASSSASELSTHTSVPRNFDVLEQPRRRSESPHSIHELLRSPHSPYARNHHGGARVLRVSNPDLHASALSSSSSEEDENGSYRPHPFLFLPTLTFSCR